MKSGNAGSVAVVDDGAKGAKEHRISVESEFPQKNLRAADG